MSYCFFHITPKICLTSIYTNLSQMNKYCLRIPVLQLQLLIEMPNKQFCQARDIYQDNPILYREAKMKPN